MALAAAFGLGALHSFEPSHAKAVMAAYFIAGRRRISDAVALGIIVSFAHTASVLALAVGARLAATHWTAENIKAPAEFIGGLVTLGLGIWILLRARRHREMFRPASHEHEHDCPYPHAHDGEGSMGLKQLFVAGFACGLVPCPDGLALLPTALGVGNLALSIWLVIAFSAGIGAVVIALGIFVCKAQTASDRFFGGLDKHSHKIQFASGLLIAVVGAILTARAALAM